MALATAVLLARWQRFWTDVARDRGIGFAVRLQFEIEPLRKALRN
jgi:hypothetical protein